MLGVSPRSVRRYKEGTRAPRKDILFKLSRVAKASKGFRKTKSVKRRRARAEKIIREHPEVIYFETRKSFKYAETEHIDLFNIRVEDVDALIEYLTWEGCEAAYFVIHGIDSKTKEERCYSSEVMSLEDFSEAWREELSSLLQQYGMRITQIDLIGIKYHAPSSQAG